MRKDMFKVIVERPRGFKVDDAHAKRRRNDPDGPTRLGMRAGFGPPRLNENLSPLRRYLHAQVGRPWNKVYSEIAANIDRRNTVQQHIYQHLDDFIAIQVKLRDGELIDLSERSFGDPEAPTLRQKLYVDPRTGLIRVNKRYSTWKTRAAARRQALAAIATQRRVIDRTLQLHCLAGEWFEVRLAAVPLSRDETAVSPFDVVLKCAPSPADSRERHDLYGSGTLYAVSKRQLSRREIRDHELR